MTRRPGLSLTEVLVALFIMALGTVAILTLFPLGAYNLGQALKDDRTAQCAIQADTYMRTYWQTNIVEVYQAIAATGGSGDPDFAVAFTQPNQMNVSPTTIGGALTATNNNPVSFPASSTTFPNLPPANTTSTYNAFSYPVFVDPMGVLASWGGQTNVTNDQKNWVGTNGSTLGLPRRPLSQAQSSNAQAVRVCSLMDGLSFFPASTGIPGGVPIDPGTNTVDRDYRYNWLWVLQRPNCQNPFSANMTVVVFDQRPFGFVMNNAEMAISVNFQPTSTNVVVPNTTGVVLKKGGWVMDGTISPSTSIFHANFYRIVSATDDGAGHTNLELQIPIHRNDGLTGAAATYTGTLIVLSGVSEVFERPVLVGQ